MKLLKFLLPALFVIACNSSSTKELDALYDELVKGHDEVMPKSMAIPALINDLNQVTEGASEEKKAEVSALVSRLNKAEMDMNDWMVAFSDAIQEENETQKLESYKKLQSEIIQLKDDTEQAIADAKLLTGKAEAL